MEYSNSCSFSNTCHRPGIMLGVTISSTPHDNRKATEQRRAHTTCTSSKPDTRVSEFLVAAIIFSQPSCKTTITVPILEMRNLNPRSQGHEASK